MGVTHPPWGGAAVMSALAIGTAAVTPNSSALGI